MLLHKTFCTGEVFALCRESAASFRAEVVTMIPARLQHRYAWGLRLHAPLPTARILPKQTKDWLKARPIISFFRTWAAPLLTVFGALIFELTKVTFPDVPGQLSVQELVQQLWDALSCADPTEYIQLVSQDLSGFFTSIPTERFQQALQVLLHRYEQVVGLRNTSHWSVYEVKSDHRRRMVKGKRHRKPRFLGHFVRSTFSVSLTSSLTTVTSRSTATCSGRNAALPWITSCSYSAQSRCYS